MSKVVFKWNVFFVGLLCILGILMLSWTSTYGHERVHEYISEYAGCNASIEFKYFSDSYTNVYCEDNLSMTPLEFEIYKSDVALEFFDYKVHKILNIFMLMIIGAFFIMYLNKQDEGW